MRTPLPLHRHASRGRSTMLVALLAMTLALAGTLAYEAHDAARSHRATAERALHDYAGFAAWELLSTATAPAQSALSDAFSPMTGARAATPYDALPGPAVLAPLAMRALRCAAPADDSLRTVFRLDLRDGSLATAGATLAPREAARLASEVSDLARSHYRPDWRYAVAALALGAGPRAVAYSVKWAEHGAPIAVYGFTTCEDAIGAPLFAPVLEHHALLPAAVTGSAPNDSLVSVVVLDADGDTLVRSATLVPSPFTADARTEAFDGLVARVALRPVAVERLALGALPSSKLPLLLGLLALTAGLVIVALLQFRREQELQRLRSDFVSSVSHELRTPLAQILLFAETLSLGRVRTAEERRDAADIIVQEARRLGQLVDNVLHVSRAERGMARLSPTALAVAPLVREVLEMWRPLAHAADVRLESRLDEHAVAMADADALRQMLLNLLDNAVKYGPAGQTVLVALTAADGVARIAVSDEGPGVPPEERERVWEPFYRLPREVRSASAGSGIGLFVVRELARLHGGRAFVDGTSGGGARVVIELPRAALGAVPRPALTAALAAQPETAS